MHETLYGNTVMNKNEDYNLLGISTSKIYHMKTLIINQSHHFDFILFTNEIYKLGNLFKK